MEKAEEIRQRAIDRMIADEDIEITDYMTEEEKKEYETLLSI